MNRTRQVFRFLIVARLLLWTLWTIYRERRRVIRARQSGQHGVKPRVDVLIRVLTEYRTTALRMGVLLIKLGQFLSSRADLLPDQALAVLADLQDRVPAVPFSEVRGILESELDRPIPEVFSHVDTEAAAAASLGQVHKGILAQTGETVAIKVQRPDIGALVQMDLSTLKFVIWVIRRFVRTEEFMDLDGLYREFRRTILEELDYVAEAANARRFRDMFADDPTVFIPAVHERLTTRRLLVLQWIDGVKVNDHAALDALGIDRRVVADRLVGAYLHQFFAASFYHADPHPGNVLVKVGGEYGPEIHLLDFGMVGTLTPAMQKSLKDLFMAYLQREARPLVSALGKLGFIGKGADMDSIERAVSLILERYHGMSMRQARDLDLGEVARDIEDLLYGQPFQVPTRFAFTGRAIGTLVGVTTGLAPDFNFVDTAAPYARDFMGLEGDPQSQALRQLLKQAGDAGLALLRLPRLMERVATRLETGQIDVGVIPSSGERRRRRAPRRSSLDGLGPALMVSTEVASGAALVAAHQPAAGWFLLGFAALTVAIGSFRS